MSSEDYVNAMRGFYAAQAKKPKAALDYNAAVILGDPKKKPKPYITNDPNDPRIQAYNDSLSLYNNEKKLYESEAIEYAKKLGMTTTPSGVSIEDAYKYDDLLDYLKVDVGYTPITSTKLIGYNKPKQEVVLQEQKSGVGTPVSKTREPMGSISVMGKAIPYYSEDHKKKLVEKFEPYGVKDWKGDGNYSHSMTGHKFRGWSEGKLYDKKGNVIYKL